MERLNDTSASAFSLAISELNDEHFESRFVQLNFSPEDVSKNRELATGKHFLLGANIAYTVHTSEETFPDYGVYGAATPEEGMVLKSAYDRDFLNNYVPSVYGALTPDALLNQAAVSVLIKTAERMRAERTRLLGGIVVRAAAGAPERVSSELIVARELLEETFFFVREGSLSALQTRGDNLEYEDKAVFQSMSHSVNNGGGLFAAYTLIKLLTLDPEGVEQRLNHILET